ncbi:MAG TPA: nuclear transport factor 2 family protein [Pseudolysinimonas sp.]|jgi:ketosteroid isomerase-like protein
MTTDKGTVETWMAGYRRAWDSSNRDDIRALFTADASYRTAPFEEPRVGADAIVEGWVEDRDEPDDYDFTWSLAGIDGDLAFVEGETTYNGSRHGSARRYSNLWVIRFAPDGRASSFTEWYMRQGAAGAPGSLG